MRERAVFLDRDGTINVSAAVHEYILTRQDFRFLPRARAALAFLAQNFGGKIVIVTNQSPVGRGLATWEQVLSLHTWMERQIEEAGGRIDGIYVCPHTPEDKCACRKPKPGLLLTAAQGLDLDLINLSEPKEALDLSRSVMIGDTLSDMQAAWAAGIRECYRVRTGLSFEEPLQDMHKYTVVGTLSEAVMAIVGKEQTDGIL